MALSLSIAPDGAPNGTPNNAPLEHPDRKITLTLPASVVRELKRRMAAEETTMRVLVLQALADAGYAVALDELRDRRRR